MSPEEREAFERQLAEYRELAVVRLLEDIPAREPQRHLYAVIRDYLARTGKGVRPALCLATCRAFGGSTEQAVPSAAAIELLHNAFLVHDDIEDESELRRDQPTMHASHGVPIAVNAGDAMNAMTIGFLRRNQPILGPALSWQVLAEFESMLHQTLEGQAIELGWIRDNVCSVTRDDYLRMVLKKTCFYSFIHPCRIGALIASGSPHGLERFDRFGYFLGTAFQIQDDILNLVGNQRSYGKEIGGDLLEGKRTLMLTDLFDRTSPDEGARLRAYLELPRSRRSQDDLRWVYGLLERYGSIERARVIARQLVSATYNEFESAFGNAHDGPDKEFIRRAIAYMVEREA